MVANSYDRHCVYMDFKIAGGFCFDHNWAFVKYFKIKFYFN